MNSMVDKKGISGVKKRFIEKFGEDYFLFSKAYPHFKELQEKISKEIFKFCNGKEDCLVLEIGCGSGATSLEILKRNKCIKLMAVDNEIEMIKQVKKNLKDYSGRVEFFHEDALSFLKKIKSSTYDVFVSAWVIHNFEEVYRNKVLKEIFRILKKGGLFVNGDKYALDNLKARHRAFNWSIKQYLSVYPLENRDDYCYDWIIHMAEDEKSGVLMPERESIRLMRELGFGNLKIVWRKKMEAIVVAIKK